MNRRRILLAASAPAGGLAEHTFYQARALARLGVQVEVLTCPSFLPGRPLPFACARELPDPPAAHGSRLARRLRLVWHLLRLRFGIFWRVLRDRPYLVLWDSYAEYLAPLWVWPHWFAARGMGITYAANLHDPVRDYQVGPAWWHKLSVRLAYLPFKFVLVHQKLAQPGVVPRGIEVVEVPVGVYDLPETPVSREAMRSRWQVTPRQKVFLAFGYLRDGKNLDLAIRAVKAVPDAVLVIAGAVPSAKDKPFSFYRELAAREGVGERVVFHEGFASDEALAGYFAGTDFVLLTYSATFHSQSGVLNLAAKARKPVLASAAPSPLLESVGRFQLGVIVPPDSSEAIAAGMQSLLHAAPAPRWDDYEAVASWEANALGILRAARLAPAAPAAPVVPAPAG
jgi:glycosyltransferase involved in cell wall biosynthesis